MNRSVYSFLHFPAPDMTAGGYILTDGQHQHGGYAYTKRRGGLQYPSTCNAEGAGEPSPQQKKDRRFHGGSDMKRGSGTVILLHMHYVGRSFRLLNPLYVRSCVFGAFFPAENFTIRKFSAGNRRENAQTRRNGRTLMKRGETSAGRMVS